MPKVNYVTHSGETYTVDVPVGWSVMEGAIQNDVPGIVAECGGGCACATCHVFVDPKWADKLADRSSMEKDMLECTAAESNEKSRLSCQLKVSEECDGLTVYLPETQT
jgi:ferredoxin, 2Fe-2S